MNCIIIDDEPLARAELQALILEHSALIILDVFSNVSTARAFLKENMVDLIFLDIEMPNISGVEFAESLVDNTLVVFTTAYPQYALKSYELEAIDYLLKPIDEVRLKKAINKASLFSKLLSNETEKSSLESFSENFLLIKSERRFHKINFDEIKYVEGLKDYVVLYIGDQRLITAMNLKTIHQKMPQDIFIRISKSYVVNLNFIESFDHHGVMIDDVEIPIGEVYKKEFFRIYTNGSLYFE
ncbi:LytR/AlgR family response regulator transcription factor [Sphingobacterium sp. HSC-15S19]|uniref:LytR/AlgR family response regulator transcription factor n=1 Tax=Sphingobacterium TaxID=28453 RepID=UPI003D228F05